MSNHTEDKMTDQWTAQLKLVHNYAIDNCLKAMRKRLDSANSLTIDLMNSIMEDFHDLKKR